MYLLRRTDQCEGTNWQSKDRIGLGQEIDDHLPEILFAWQISSILVVWWLFPLLDCIYNRYRGRTPKFFNSVLWSCTQSCIPGSAAYFAIMTEDDHERRLITFFKGMPLHSGTDETKMPLLIAFLRLCEHLYTVVPIIGVLSSNPTACSGKATVITWLFPTLPSAVIGIWMVVDCKLELSNTRKGSITGCTILVLLVTGALAASIHLTKTKYDTYENWYPVPIFLMMCIPWSFISRLWKVCAYFLCVFVGTARTFGILYHSSYSGPGGVQFPFPALQKEGYGWVYAMLGGLLPVSLGIRAFFLENGPIKVRKDRAKGENGSEGTVQNENATETREVHV